MAPPAKKRKTTDETYLCSTCTTSRRPTAFPDYNPTPECEHLINTCTSCLRRWVKLQVEAGNLAAAGDDDAVFGVKCPECDGIMRSVNIETAATKKTYNTFEELKRKHIADTTPGWRWCMNPQCRAGQVHVMETSSRGGKKSTKTKSAKAADICTCHQCGAMACVPCDRPWHAGETCAQYQARIKDRVDEEDKALRHIQLKTKPCPKCKKRIEKNGGCPMMLCTQCHTGFCWTCGETIVKRSCGCNRQRPAAHPS